MVVSYKFTTILNKEGKWYTAKCVDLGVVSQGRTIEQAQENLKEAVGLYLDGQPKLMKKLPKVSPFITTFDLTINV